MKLHHLLITGGILGLVAAADSSTDPFSWYVDEKVCSGLKLFLAPCVLPLPQPERPFA